MFAEIWTHYKEGGWPMWVILLWSVFVFAIIIERALYLWGGSIAKDVFISTMQKCILAGDVAKAVKMCSAANAPLARIVQAGLVKVNRPDEEVQAAMDEAALREIPKIAKRTGLLALLANLSMLTGLLGTVSGLITSFVAEASREVKALDPKTDVQVHVVPWTEATFNNALLWNAAQDLTALANYVDVVSPMVYHKLIGRPTDYIRTLTAEFAAKTKKRVVPSIQMAQIVSEGDVSADEFRQSLDDALQAPSSGTLIFHWGELRLDEAASALRREKHDIFKAAANP